MLTGESRQGGGVSLHPYNPPLPCLSPQVLARLSDPQAGEQVPGGGEGGDGHDLRKESGPRHTPIVGRACSWTETAGRPLARPARILTGRRGGRGTTSERPSPPPGSRYPMPIISSPTRKVDGPGVTCRCIYNGSTTSSPAHPARPCLSIRLIQVSRDRETTTAYTSWRILSRRAYCTLLYLCAAPPSALSKSPFLLDGRPSTTTTPPTAHHGHRSHPRKDGLPRLGQGTPCRSRGQVGPPRARRLARRLWLHRGGAKEHHEARRPPPGDDGRADVLRQPDGPHQSGRRQHCRHGRGSGA